MNEFETSKINKCISNIKNQTEREGGRINRDGKKALLKPELNLNWFCLFRKEKNSTRTENFTIEWKRKRKIYFISVLGYKVIKKNYRKVRKSESSLSVQMSLHKTSQTVRSMWIISPSFPSLSLSRSSYFSSLFCSFVLYNKIYFIWPPLISFPFIWHILTVLRGI